MSLSGITTASPFINTQADITTDILRADTAIIPELTVDTINGVPFSGGGIGNLLPSQNLTYNIGSSSYKWLIGYINSVVSNSLTANSASIPALTVSTINGAPYSGGSIGNLEPSTTDIYNLGSNSKKWLIVYSNYFHGQISDTQTTLNANTLNATTLTGQLTTAQTSLSGTTATFTNLYGQIKDSVQDSITTLTNATNLNGVTINNIAGTTQISATNLTGTLTTSNQPNITEIGSLTATLFTRSLAPSTTELYSLGSPSFKYTDVYSQNLYGTVKDAAQTSITSLGTLTALTISGDIKPNSNGAISLGDNTHYFNHGYINNVVVGNQLKIDNLSTGVLHSNMAGIVSSSEIVNADVSASAAIVDTKLAQINTPNKVANSATSATAALTNGAIVARDVSGGFLAGAVGVTSLSVGSLGTVFNTSGSNLIFQNPTTNGDIIMQFAPGGDSNFQIKNNAGDDLFSIYDYGSIFTRTIIPHAANTYDLGSAGSRFRNFYADTSTISGSSSCLNLTTNAGINTFNTANTDNQLVLNQSNSSYRLNMFFNVANQRSYELGVRGSPDDYFMYAYGIAQSGGGSSGWCYQIDKDLIFKTYQLQPIDDNSKSCGSSGKRWSEIYAASGTINTSDQRAKENITTSNLGLDFINRLNPVSYKFKNYTSTSVPDKDGITTPINHTFTRKHYGLIAQEVKSVMDTLNIPTNDFAGYVYNAESDTYGLRYEEFISPLIKSIKEIKEILDRNNIV